MRGSPHLGLTDADSGEDVRKTLSQQVAVCTLMFVTLYCTGQEPRFSKDNWLEDFAQLKQALEHSYSNLAWFASPQSGVDIPGLNQTTLHSLQVSTTDDEARNAILYFVDSFHDGHFSALSTLAPSSVPVKPIPDFRFRRNDPEAGCAALGFSLNGTVAFSLPFESLPGFHLLREGTDQPFHAGTVTLKSGKRVGLLRLAEFDDAVYPSLCIASWHRDVWDKHGILRPAVLQEYVTAAWYGSLSRLFRRWRRQGVSAVLVDLGDNPGGDDSGNDSAGLMSGKPIHSARVFVSQDRTASGELLDENLRKLTLEFPSAASDRLQAIRNESVRSFRKSETDLDASCSLDWVWITQRDWNTMPCRRLVPAGSAGGPVDYLDPSTTEDQKAAELLYRPSKYVRLWRSWTEPLFILTDSRSYSSAEMLAAMLQDNGAAKIIGARTGGDGCGFMDGPAPVTLRHSKMRFRIPNCIRLRSDGTDEVAGVKPDISIVPTAGEDRRARASRVLAAME